MAMNSEAPSKHGGNGGGELEKRVTGIETRLGVIGKTMVTAEVLQRELGALRKEMHAEFVALRVEIARMPYETINWLLAVFGIAAAITTTVYSIWFR